MKTGDLLIPKSHVTPQEIGMIIQFIPSPAEQMIKILWSINGIEINTTRSIKHGWFINETR
jgi:hypothetical protein